MNEIRKFKVLKNTYGRMSIYEGRPLMRKGEIVEVEVLKNNIYVYDNWRFHPSWFDMWLTEGYLEEILPDKKPILSEENKEMLDYERKYNLYEIMKLLEKMPYNTLVVNDYDECLWYLNDNERNLSTRSTHDNRESNITDEYKLLDIMYMTFTLVKPVEEVKEKWVRINNHKDLATAISKGKEIVAFNTHTKVTTIRTRVFTDRIIDKLFEQLEYNYIEIKYLEEN